MLKNSKIVSVGLNPDDYHEHGIERGTAQFPVSPSSLKEFMRCPGRWKDGYVSPGSSSLAFGTFLDCLLLTPELFASRFAVKPSTYKDAKTGEEKPWNGNAGVCKEWLASVDGKEVISRHELADVQAARERILKEPDIARFLEQSDRQVYVTAEWHDEATGLVIPLRCLIDLAPTKDSEFAKCLGDLKSSRSGALIPFQRQVHQFGWHIQAAFDTDLYTAATGEDRNTWCFVGQENFHPWQPFKRMLSQDFIELGRSEYTRALKNYAACLKHGHWPGYDDNDEAIQGWSLCQTEPWMANLALFAPKFEFGDEAEDEPEPERFDVNN